MSNKPSVLLVTSPQVWVSHPHPLLVKGCQMQALIKFSIPFFRKQSLTKTRQEASKPGDRPAHPRLRVGLKLGLVLLLSHSHWGSRFVNISLWGSWGRNPEGHYLPQGYPSRPLVLFLVPGVSVPSFNTCIASPSTYIYFLRFWKVKGKRPTAV